MTPHHRAGPPPPPLLSVPLTVALMLIAYLLVMGYVAAGLRILYRADRRTAGWRIGRCTPEGARRGWPGLIWQAASTALGGYVLLMAVVVGYYEGVARVAGSFLASAFTGCALLIGISLPLFLGVSWLVERRRRARREAGH